MTIPEILHRLWVRAVESGYLNGTEADRERSKALDDLLSLIQSGVEKRIISKDGAYPISAITPGSSGLSNTIELQGMDKLRESQRQALHQWIKELKGEK